MEEDTEKHRFYHCPEWHEVRREIQRLPESARKKREPQRRSGSDKEALSRTLSVKASGTGSLQHDKVGV